MTKPVRVERERHIRAAPTQVFHLLTRIEGLPRFLDLWLAADLLERGGHQFVAEFRGYFAGLPLESVQRLTVRPPARLDFRQTRGTFKSMRGEFVVDPDGLESRLTVRMEIDPGIPLLTEAGAQMVLTTALDRMLSKVKDAAERDLPRLTPRRPQDGEAAAARTDEARRGNGRRTGAAAAGEASAPEEPAPASDLGPAPPGPGPAPPPGAPPTTGRVQGPAAAKTGPRDEVGRRRRRRRRRRRPGQAGGAGGALKGGAAHGR